MGGQGDRQKNGRTDGRTDRQADRQVEGCTDQTDRWMDRLTGRQADRQMGGADGRTCEEAELGLDDGKKSVKTCCLKSIEYLRPNGSPSLHDRQNGWTDWPVRAHRHPAWVAQASNKLARKRHLIKKNIRYSI